jgi:hypothetical protein
VTVQCEDDIELGMCFLWFDYVGGDSPLASVNLNGTSDTAVFNVTAPAEPGIHTALIAVSDTTPTNLTQIEVDFEVYSPVDTIPPTISSFALGPYHPVDPGIMMTLVAECHDNIGLYQCSMWFDYQAGDPPRKTVNIIGTDFPATFHVPAPIEPGIHTILFEATDQAGNKGQLTGQFEVNPPATTTVVQGVVQSASIDPINYTFNFTVYVVVANEPPDPTVIASDVLTVSYAGTGMTPLTNIAYQLGIYYDSVNSIWVLDNWEQYFS